MGFFVTGSTVHAMNGIYARVETVPGDHKHKFQLAYKNDLTGWFMGLVSGAEEGANYETHGGKSSEWLIIDDKQHDRFAHEGDTVIPGAGIKWTHMHRSAPHGDAQAPSAESSTDQQYDDNEDELPWQVIYIGDPSMVNKLRHHQHYHSRVRSNAIAGTAVYGDGGEKPLPKIEFNGEDATRSPHGPPSAVKTTISVAGAGAEEARNEGDFEKCAEEYEVRQ
jgi:hypothetical protein